MTVMATVMMIRVYIGKIKKKKTKVLKIFLKDDSRNNKFNFLRDE